MSKRCWLTIAWGVAGFLLAIPSTSFAQSASSPHSVTKATLEKLRADHQEVLDQLNGKNSDGIPLSFNHPNAPNIISKGWRLAGEWAAAYFETHPTPSARDLERVFDGFAPKPRGVKSKHGNFLEYPEFTFDGSAVRIGPTIYVVEGRYWTERAETGDFMVVAHNQQGHFQALWNIKDLAEKHYAQRDEIGRWVYLVTPAYYNGPLAVRKVISLPPASNGHARFLVDAYQSADGGTALAQLSIWEWDGSDAKPLLVDIYHYAWDFAGFHFNGTTLQITTKEDLETLSACGMCPEPAGVWALRITPDGVTNLGHQFADPEIQWADEFLTCIGKGKDASNLADIKVVTALKAYMKKTQAEEARPDPSDKGEFSWGLLDGYDVIKRGQEGAFEVNTDQGRLRFSYVMRKGKPYFTDIQIH